MRPDRPRPIRGAPGTRPKRGSRPARNGAVRAWSCRTRPGRRARPGTGWAGRFPAGRSRAGGCRIRVCRCDRVPLLSAGATGLPAVGAAADLIGRLVVDRGAATEVAISQPVAGSVPGALDAVVHDRSLRQRTAGVGTLLMQREDRLALADENEVVDPQPGLGGRTLRQLHEVASQVATGRELDREPFRPGAAPGVAIDHVAEHIGHVA